MREEKDPEHRAGNVLTGLIITGCLFVAPAAAQETIGNDEATLAELQSMKAQIERQKQQIARQTRQLTDQQQVISNQEAQIDRMISRLSGKEGLKQVPEAKRSPPEPQRSDTSTPSRPESSRQETVGQKADQNGSGGVIHTDVPIFADVGGVLTPGGHFSLEPRVDYTHSDVKRFFFQGVEIVDVVLVGLFELTDADRDTVTGSLTARYGITDRFEIDGEVPYLYRNDRITNEAVSLNNRNLIRDLSGHGIGDAEVGLHYQFNRAGRGGPVFIANLRGKSDLGDGPFDIERDEDGLELELPVGSGFWTIEPSLTMIYTLDPAVLFLNAGYLFNMPKNVNAQVGDQLISRVNPGDTIRGGFGMGIGLNEKLSLSLGYEHNYIYGTRTFIEETRLKTNAFHVGSFLFGLSLGLTDHIGLNFNTQLGMTADAPDVRVSLRVPIRF